ncbi:MAG: lysyl oxidase family protein [Chloroflexota bacterium]
MTARRILAGALALAVIAAGWGAGVPATRAAHTEDATLPDLVMLPPSDFKIEQQARKTRLLRFSTVIVNLGPGPFQVLGQLNGATSGDPYDVVQHLAEPGGGLSDHPTGATMFWSGDGHNHFHVRDLQEMTLQNLNALVLARGAKRGFCFWDNYNYGAPAPAYYHPSTTDACELAPDGTVPMGLSVRWGDRYPYNIAFQYIDISKLGNGEYLVTVAADPAAPGETGQFIEANEQNNTAWARIRINRKSVTVLATSGLP